MRRAIPAIAVSAAGLTWLLHAQGVIDSQPSGGSTVVAGGAPGASTPTTKPSSSSVSSTTPTTNRTPPRQFPGDDEDGPLPTRPSTSTTSTVTTTTPGGGGPGVSGTFDGPTVNTRYGPVQVEVVISNGRITTAKTLKYPDDRGRSIEINQQAVPMLNDEVVSAQSANIDIISGATYTSDGYAQSLQSALDKAGFKR